MVASVVRCPFVVRQHLQKTSPLKLLGQFPLNFICSLQVKAEKVNLFGLGQTTKMDVMPWTSCPFMVKTLRTLLLQNRKTDCLKTWNVAFGGQFYKFYINDVTELSLIYFTTMSIGPLGFVMGKTKNCILLMLFCSHEQNCI